MRIFAIAVIAIMSLCTAAFSEVIHFKEGGSVEGIIQEDGEDYLIIDIGIGTMSIRKDEIDHVEESSAEELERFEREKLDHEIDIGEWAPIGYEEIRMAYLGTKSDREALKGAKRKSDMVKGDIKQKKKRISELLELIAKKGEELNAIDSKKDTEKYNAVVTEMNSLNADLDRENNKLKELSVEEKKLDADLAKKSGEYRNSFQTFKDSLHEKQRNTSDDEMLSDELYFFEEMNDKIREIEGDFKKDVVEYTPEGNQVIVDALIEDNVLVRLIVDTGASIVVISQDVAHRLGIGYEDIPTEIEITMADGSAVGAKPIILKSVKIGDAEVKDVQAAILETNIIGGADGLLGMSFLSNFIIKVDSATNKLILEKVL